jgi:hypothetical protein
MRKKLFVSIMIIFLVACNRNTSTPQRISFFTPTPSSSLIYYAQTDPRWSDTVLTCSNGRRSTFFHQGCGETSFAMLMATFVDQKYTPATVLDDFYGYSYCAGTDALLSVQYLGQQGFTISDVHRGTEGLREYLKDGWLGWIHVEYGGVAHETLVTGVDDNNNLIMTDPFYGVGSITDYRFPYNENDIVGFYAVKPPSQ